MPLITSRDGVARPRTPRGPKSVSLLNRIVHHEFPNATANGSDTADRATLLIVEGMAHSLMRAVSVNLISNPVAARCLGSIALALQVGDP